MISNWWTLVLGGLLIAAGMGIFMSSSDAANSSKHDAWVSIEIRMLIAAGMWIAGWFFGWISLDLYGWIKVFTFFGVWIAFCFVGAVAQTIISACIKHHTAKHKQGEKDDNEAENIPFGSRKDRVEEYMSALVKRLRTAQTDNVQPLLNEAADVIEELHQTSTVICDNAASAMLFVSNVKEEIENTEIGNFHFTLQRWSKKQPYWCIFACKHKEDKSLTGGHFCVPEGANLHEILTLLADSGWEVDICKDFYVYGDETNDS